MALGARVSICQNDIDEGRQLPTLPQHSRLIARIHVLYNRILPALSEDLVEHDGASRNYEDPLQGQIRQVINFSLRTLYHYL